MLLSLKAIGVVKFNFIVLFTIKKLWKFIIFCFYLRQSNVQNLQRPIAAFKKFSDGKKFWHCWLVLLILNTGKILKILLWS